jgi:hypothetical protein
LFTAAEEEGRETGTARTGEAADRVEIPFVAFFALFAAIVVALRLLFPGGMGEGASSSVREREREREHIRKNKK